MTGNERWSDLAARMISGAVMVVVGLGAVAFGGDVFHLFVAAICGAMIWELVRMVSPDQPALAWQLGAGAGTAVMVAIYLPVGLALPLLFLPALVGLGRLDHNRTVFTTFSVLVVWAGFGMMTVRDELGFLWMLWLASVVVVTDVAGYFAGRFLGGPKFWPRVSPKKTWSGTAAGWLGAAAVGLGFAGHSGAGLQLIGVSVAVSMASQMGDIAESAVKRKMHVKDSSALIPGHGGLLDRFDGMLGASVFFLMVMPFIGLPAELP
ncbi:MAG: phosphatidate cytidylyltransferase [Rhodobacteraceae bacterium]|nr:phosphatidate cytidylyltransferase [Paracoccaceae bacterium]